MTLKPSRTAQQEKAVHLTRLVIARRAELSKDELAVYLDGVRDLPAWAVERACRQLAFTPRGAYEPAMPELGAIRTRAEAQMRLERDRQASSRLLQAPDQAPVPPEKVASFLADLRQVIQKKAMPRG